MDALNAVDMALQAATPVVMVPRFQKFEPMDTSGHRFLAAQDGFWLELWRPWVHLIHQVAPQHVVPMPYGKLEARREFLFGKLPRKLILDFVDMARAACPHETAAWIVWNSETNEFDLRTVGITSAGNAHVKFDRPDLSADEYLIVDLHSHGKLPAFFSEEDDRDDLRGEAKICIVVGSCHKELSIKSRLCAVGLAIDLNLQL